MNATSEIVTGIHLKPKNLHEKGQRSSEYVEIANIRFWVFRGKNTEILGAELA